jgi:hypothetical protein
MMYDCDLTFVPREGKSLGSFWVHVTLCEGTGARKGRVTVPCHAKLLHLRLDIGNKVCVVYGTYRLCVWFTTDTGNLIFKIHCESKQSSLCAS